MIQLRRKTVLKLSSHGLKPFPLDEGRDEGPGVPARYIAAKAALDHDVNNVKLDVDKETVMYLKEIHGISMGEAPDLEGEVYKTRKVRAIVARLHKRQD